MTPPGNGARADDPLRIIFFVRSANYDRHFERVLWALAERGHRLHVSFDIRKKDETARSTILEEIAGVHPNVTFGPTPMHVREHWRDFGAGVRHSLDFLRYLEGEYAGADALRERAEQRAPKLLSRLLRLRAFRPPFARRLLGALLRRVDAAIPVDPTVEDTLSSFRPDLVLVSPLVGLGSAQGEYVRAARSGGIPSALLVASWDNLTNKGVVREVPDLTIVWNEAQVEEAVELQSIPRERVVAVGAHTYDHWFDWRPATTRHRFCEKVGLDPDRPFILYVGSSYFIAPQEPTFVRSWIDAVRDSGRPELEEAGILVRPHPANTRSWSETDVAEPGRVSIWPPMGAAPTTEQSKADYFDSIYHSAAIMGINTSAQIESAIVRRSVHSLRTDEFRSTQEGTLHFSHIASSDDGLLLVGRDLPEHLEQLSESLTDGQRNQERIERFVRRFLRPRGLDEPTAPQVVSTLEDLAAGKAEAPDPRTASGALRSLLAPVARWHTRVAQGLRALGLAIRPAPMETRDAGVSGRRFLFVLDHPGYLIHFDSVVRSLLERGHRIHMTFGRDDKYAYARASLDDVTGGLRFEKRAPRRHDAYAAVAEAIRASRDYLHYLQPGMAGARFSRAKWRQAAAVPRSIRRLESPSPPAAKALQRTFALLESAIPATSAASHLLERIKPDAVVVSPLLSRDAYALDLVKSARSLGIPSALCVASWDNLTSKGRLKIAPDLVSVWNRVQAEQATGLHDLPAERVAITGAPQFDRWQDRSPSASRESFCTSVGLDPARKFVIFAGSTNSTYLGVDPQAELDLVRRWQGALAEAEEPELRELQILVRPHPTAVEIWASHDLDGIVVWSPPNALPVLDEDRSDYFDALHHSAAVVGVNTSVLLEAAIVGTPAHSIQVPELRELQRGLLHYRELLAENGGPVHEAIDLDEHLRLLALDVADPGIDEARRRRFVSSFVYADRETGTATESLATELERLATARPRRPRPRPGLTPVRVWLVAWDLAIRVGRMRDALARRLASGGASSRTGRRLLRRLGDRRAGRPGARVRGARGDADRATEPAKPAKPKGSAKPPKSQAEKSKKPRSKGGRKADKAARSATTREQRSPNGAPSPTAKQTGHADRAPDSPDEIIMTAVSNSAGEGEGDPPSRRSEPDGLAGGPG